MKKDSDDSAAKKVRTEKMLARYRKKTRMRGYPI